jgi:hypothetical protein
MKRLLASGWARLALVAWVPFVVWTWQFVDARRPPTRWWWSVGDYASLVWLGFVIPALAAWTIPWVVRGFTRQAPADR